MITMRRVIIALIFLGFIAWPLIRYSYQYDEPEIRLGMSAPLSGDLRELGNNFYMGASAFFQDLNSKGGVHGRDIKLLVKNDKYEPKIAIENVKDFIEKDKVFALFGVVGTPTSKEVLPIALENKIPFLAAVTGAKFLRKPRNAMILNVRKGYHGETKALLEYIVDKMKKKRIAVFYQNDSFGHTGIRSLKEELRDRGMGLVGEGSYKRNTLAVGHAIYEIENSRPDAIIMFSAAKPAVEFVRRARKSEILKDAMLGVVSFAGAEAVVRDLGMRAGNMVFSQVVPLPWGESIDVGHYRRQMNKFYPTAPIGFASLEGYFAAKMVTSIFRKVGKDFSHDSFIDALHDIPKEIFQDKSIIIKDNSCGCLDKIYVTRYTQKGFETIGESHERSY